MGVSNQILKMYERPSHNQVCSTGIILSISFFLCLDGMMLNSTELGIDNDPVQFLN